MILERKNKGGGGPLPLSHHFLQKVLSSCISNQLDDFQCYDWQDGSLLVIES